MKYRFEIEMFYERKKEIQQDQDDPMILHGQTEADLYSAISVLSTAI